MPHAFPAIYELGPEFYDEVRAAQFPKLILRYRNQDAAKKLGLDQLSEEQWKNHFGRFLALPENIRVPLALRYHGHQFLHYNPDLGDGRGFLFAQIQADRLYDLGTKGSGQTPYSRAGDGRLTLKGAFREILATELLESYGVNTSRSFSVFETGENLHRNDEPSPTRSAVLVRMNHSHIRFGTFQRLAYFQQPENLRKLTQYCLRFYFPELWHRLQNSSPREQMEGFLTKVRTASAKNVASWMMCGFVHGVMNTDNMNITGESFDYGPYRFLPRYQKEFTAAYFDSQGLYSFSRQPLTMLWNLQQLAACLQSAEPELETEKILEDFADDFNEASTHVFLSRLNLFSQGTAEDAELLHSFFEFMDLEKPAYEQVFFDLHSGLDENRLSRSPLAELYTQSSFEKCRRLLASFKVADSTKPSHPYFKNSTPCTLLIDELENIWKQISENDDWRLFQEKLEQIRSFRGVY